jgi:hypothetical protein
MKKLFTVAFSILMAVAANGQTKSDTVVVSLARTSKVVFTMQDRSDLEILKHYNFQELFHDILERIESNDTAKANAAAEQPVARTEEHDHDNWKRSDDNDRLENRDSNDDEDEEWNKRVENRRNRVGRTWQSTNFDLGMNNYLSDGEFPDQDNATHAVRPWGSWYVGAASIQRTRLGRNFFLEWGIGLSWYTFKFENDDIVITKDDDGIQFLHDARGFNYKKSKLSASYINASFVPVIDFNDRSRKPRMWDGYGNSFRLGIGPYVGYRIASRTKLVYSEDGDLEKEKNRDSFYLNNLRYGARLQLGFRNTDLFFNYDLNELFVEGKAPKLNAFSFGVIF